MKTIGVVRRIDDLGRIVIPKEIRKTLKIREGDSLEIKMNEGNILLNKFSPLKNIESIGMALIDSLEQETKNTIAITDMETIVAISKTGKNALGKHISPQLEEILERGKKKLFDGTEIIQLTEEYVLDEDILIIPLVTYGDIKGSIIMFGTIDIEDEKLLDIIASFLENYIKD